MQERFGEANTLRALGDLYVRTARLEEALGAWRAEMTISNTLSVRLALPTTETKI